MPLRTSTRMSWRLKDLQWKGKFRALKPCSKGQSLIPEDFVKAEHAIIQYVQEHKFKAEIVLLKSGCKSVSKGSPLYRLNPVMDDGILRVGGRLGRAAMPAESKHPVILSKDLHVSYPY